MEEIGEYTFNEIKQSERISRDRAAIARVTRVGRRIVEAANTERHYDDWEFVVFDQNTINAFCLPGGKVAVYKGLLELVENDDQLAIVMGHEIAHVTSRHVHEAYSRGILLQTTGQIIGYGVGGQGILESAILMQVYGLGANYGVAKWSRKHENEADYVGLMYAARAGFDPREAVTLMMNLNLDEIATGTEYLSADPMSSHPTTPSRIKHIQEIMPDAIKEYEFATGSLGL